MKIKRVQVVLPDGLVEKFEKEAKRQGRSESNLARLFIVAGLKNISEQNEPQKSA